MIAAKGIFANKSILGTQGIYGAAGIATGGGAAWTPASLTNLLWWYNIYDLSKMWQDSAKTTPVTGDNQPVGYIEDSSGNGHDVHQTTAGKRPIFKTAGGLNWLEFTGAGGTRALNSVNTIDQSASQNVTVCAGVTTDINATMAIAESSAQWFTNNGAWMLYSESQRYRMAAKGSGAVLVADIALSATITAPNTRVVVGIAPMASNNLIRTNQTEVASSANTKGAIDYGNYTLYIGARAGTSLYYDGSIYSLFATTDILTGADLTNSETYIAEKSGVTL